MIKKETISFFKTLFAALICAGIIRSLIFEPFYIPSGSMKPNLLVGDYLIVSKYSYGYSRYSFPFGINFFSGRIFFDEENQKPKRGDIAVFRFPQDTSVNYIKRIIGFAGDEIQMRDGVLYINNQKIEKNAIGKFTNEEGDSSFEVEMFDENLTENLTIKTLDIYKDLPQDNTGVFKVPDGHYFVMGDNRDNSQDSRFLSEVGFVPEENLIGKARFIFFSTRDSFWKFWNWKNSIRFNRIFKKL